MSKRFDNRRILYILAGLTAILAITILVKVPKEKATIKDKLVEIDTARVNKIIFYPRVSESKPFEFDRKKGTWTIQQGNVVAFPEKGATENILAAIMDIRPTSLEAVDKSKWKDFNLTDSLAIRVKLIDGKGKTMADLMIGRFSYSQPKNPYAGMNGGNVQGTSYVRLYNERKVYGVDGFLSLSFSGKFDDYRDKTFIKLKREDVTRVSFTLAADSSFVLNRKDSVWYAGDHAADSLAVANYLNSLRYLNGQDIRDNFKPGTNPLCQLSVEGNNLLNISVKCYRGETADDYILNSSLNPDVWFASKKDGIFDKIFKSEKYFLTKSLKKTK